MGAIKIHIWKPSRCVNWVQKRQNSKRKDTPNVSWFPHLETRSLNHLFTGNLKILNLSGHLSRSSIACSFGISTGINKVNLRACCISPITDSENCTGECYVALQKWNQKHLTALCSTLEQQDTVQKYRHLKHTYFLAETIQFYLTRCSLDTYTHHWYLHTSSKQRLGLFPRPIPKPLAHRPSSPPPVCTVGTKGEGLSVALVSLNSRVAKERGAPWKREETEMDVPRNGSLSIPGRHQPLSCTENSGFFAFVLCWLTPLKSPTRVTLSSFRQTRSQNWRYTIHLETSNLHTRQ